MKVSKAIEMLKGMNPDSEIIIEWWDVNCFHDAVVDADGNDIPLIPQNVWDAFAHDFSMRDSVMEDVWNDIQWGLQDYVTQLTKEVK